MWELSALSPESPESESSPESSPESVTGIPEISKHLLAVMVVTRKVEPAALKQKRSDNGFAARVTKSHHNPEVVELPSFNLIGKDMTWLELNQ